QPLAEQQRVRQGPLPAAEGARPRQGQPALVGQGPQERARMGARAVARVHAVDRERLGRVRAQETAYFFGECPLVRTELEVHEGGGRVTPSVRGPQPRGDPPALLLPPSGRGARLPLWTVDGREGDPAPGHYRPRADG